MEKAVGTVGDNFRVMITLFSCLQWRALLSRIRFGQKVYGHKQRCKELPTEEMKVTTETTEEQTKGLSAKIQNDAIQEFNPRFSESAAIRRRAISIPVSLAEIELPDG